jgi:hypothetical protein
MLCATAASVPKTLQGRRNRKPRSMFQPGATDLPSYGMMIGSGEDEIKVT